MAVRQPSGLDGGGFPPAELSKWLRSLSRYDLALAVIPLAFALGTAAGALTSVPLAVAQALAAVVGLVVLADALFFNPPGASPRT